MSGTVSKYPVPMQEIFSLGSCIHVGLEYKLDRCMKLYRIICCQMNLNKLAIDLLFTLQTYLINYELNNHYVSTRK